MQNHLLPWPKYSLHQANKLRSCSMIRRGSSWWHSFLFKWSYLIHCASEDTVFLSSRLQFWTNDLHIWSYWSLGHAGHVGTTSVSLWWWAGIKTTSLQVKRWPNAEPSATLAYIQLRGCPMIMQGVVTTLWQHIPDRRVFNDNQYDCYV